MSNDAYIELLTDAIALSGMSARAFAAAVLDVDERTVRRWVAGERAIPGPVRMICGFILRHPHRIGDFVQVAGDLREEEQERQLQEYMAEKRRKKKP